MLSDMGDIDVSKAQMFKGLTNSFRLTETDKTVKK